MVVVLFGFGSHRPDSVPGTHTAIERHLSRKGVEWSCFDLLDLPATEVCARLHRGVSEGWFEVDGRRVRFEDIRAVWMPFNVPAIRSKELSDEAKLFAEDEWRAFLSEFFLATRDRLWVNPLSAALETNSRIFQLRLAQQVGFETPDTLATTNEAELRNFLDQHGDQAAAKRLAAIRSTLPGGILHEAVYTHLLRKEELDALDLASLRLCPSVYQEYIAKSSEYRVYVVGTQVIAFEILSQSDPGTTVDWRRYPMRDAPKGQEIDSSRWRCRPTTLPPLETEYCRRIVERLGLRYSAIDLIRTPADRYVFLEANFGGSFLWIEEMTSVSISEPIADLLASATVPSPGERRPTSNG